MLAFILELRILFLHGHVYPFALLMVLIWALWAIRAVLARRYRPWLLPCYARASVLIPVAAEEPELFSEVLRRIARQQPHEILVVINGPRDLALEQACEAVDGVIWTWTPTAGKRNALRLAIERATGHVAVIVDSDTLWTPSTLRELVKPFRDPDVGGVTTRQRIFWPRRSVLTRWADWLETARAEYSLPAMSVLGTVGCLPGRTIALRMDVLRYVLPEFLTGRFLGIFLEVSDDRTLTNLVLKTGFRTVYQSTSLVYTDAPAKLRKLIRQQLRWARGSQYNTLRMLPWMIRNARLLALFYLADIVIPFMLIASAVSWATADGSTISPYSVLPLPAGHWLGGLALIAFAVLMTVLSVSVRFGRHFAYKPADLLYLPLFTAINTLLLMPIRVAGFMRMAHDSGWGTRGKAGYAGTRSFNPQVAIPYALTAIMLGVAVTTRV
ncbi:MAG TPA: glycosyltransferase [Streptosporangiaceae bacterium]|jgi:hyaluronan synthase